MSLTMYFEPGTILNAGTTTIKIANLMLKS